MSIKCGFSFRSSSLFAVMIVTTILGIGPVAKAAISLGMPTTDSDYMRVFNGSPTIFENSQSVTSALLGEAGAEGGMQISFANQSRQETANVQALSGISICDQMDIFHGGQGFVELFTLIEPRTGAILPANLLNLTIPATFTQAWVKCTDFNYRLAYIAAPANYFFPVTDRELPEPAVLNIRSAWEPPLIRNIGA